MPLLGAAKVRAVIISYVCYWIIITITLLQRGAPRGGSKSTSSDWLRVCSTRNVLCTKVLSCLIFHPLVSVGSELLRYYTG